MPIRIYNITQPKHVDFTPDWLAKIADLEAIDSVKESAELKNGYTIFAVKEAIDFPCFVASALFLLWFLVRYKRLGMWNAPSNSQ